MRQKIFFRSRITWRLTWPIGLAFFALKLETGIDFQWVYLYLLFVGTISFLFSIPPYIKVNELYITFYYNRFLPFMKIMIPLNEINMIKLIKTTKQMHFTAGARVRAPADFDVEKKVISILLDKGDELRSKLGKSFLSDIKTLKNGSEIVISSAPNGGFLPLIKCLQENLNKSVFDNFEGKSGRFRKQLQILDVLIILAFLYLVLLKS